MRGRVRSWVVVLAVIASALVVLLGLVTVVWAAAQFIYFAGPVGDQGTFAVLGGTTCNFSSDADHTCSQAEYAGGSINATSTGSLTATRKMILPLNAGEAKDVFNNTTGGQAITVGGSTGSPTSAIANGTQARVVTPDGVNYYAISGGGSSSLSLAGELSGSTDAATVLAATGNGATTGWDAGVGRFLIAAPEICIATDAGTRVCSTRLAGKTTSSTAWVVLGEYVPAVSTAAFCHATFIAWDTQTDGGLSGNFQKCSLEFSVVRMSTGTIGITAQGGLNGPSNIDAPLTCVSSASMYDAGGAIWNDSGAGQTVNFSFDVVADGGTLITYQVKGPDSNTWVIDNPIRCEVYP